MNDRAQPGRNANHQAEIVDQFTRQAQQFAASPELHKEAALTLLTDAAEPQADDDALDVACGPGTVVAAFARKVRRAVGLDATKKMLDEARSLAANEGLANTEWHQGDVYALPFADASFDIVSCRFAVHHFEDPPRAFAEMVRVCRQNGRIVLCDGMASDDPTKAEAFNRMELLRDPSTVEFRTLDYLKALFANAGLPPPTARFYQVAGDIERLVAMSFPAGDDRDGLRRILEDAVDGDKLGMNAERRDGKIRFGYPSVVLAARKP
jgi:ubiquinone/menaquinone biosynthesis C-methylase UbiE